MAKIIYIQKDLQNADSVALKIRDDFSKIPNVKKQAARADLHSIALTEDGSVYVVGNNEDGLLGLGNQEKLDKPKKIEGLPPIKDFTIGHSSSFLIDEYNNVYSFGDNHHGQLGLGHKNNVLVPQEITALKGCDITKVCYWASAAFFLSKDGTVYYSGTFDRDAMFYPNKPRVYNKLLSITKMDTTTDFTIFLDSTGKVHVQFDNQFTNSSHTSADFLTLSHTDILDVGIHYIDSYHGHAPYVQVLLDKSGKVFFAGLNKGLLDEPLPLPKVKRMTQGICYGNDTYQSNVNVFELYDGSLTAVKIYRNSDWDFEIIEERILANSQLSKQIKELMDKREIEDAPIQLEVRPRF